MFACADLKRMNSGSLPSTCACGSNIAFCLFFTRGRRFILLALKRHLRPLPCPIDLQVEHIVPLVSTANDIMELLRLDACVEIQIGVHNAFLALNLLSDG